MATLSFQHPNPAIGTLVIDNGIDDAKWAYGLNVATFPTFGGEVVQILSVYIDDLTLTGTCSTYAQMEAIFMYFTNFFQIATQGKNPTPVPGTSSYDLQPMIFNYPERNWRFKIFPTATPGFRYATELTAPEWQMVAHVIDDSPDLDILKSGIKAAATASIGNAVGNGGQPGSLPGTATTFDLNTLSINGEISPQYGDPNTDPFQTYDAGLAQQQQDIKKYADYYNSLIPAYMKGDFSNIAGAVGSQPSFGRHQNQPHGQTVKVPKTPVSNSKSAGNPAQALAHIF